MERVKYAFIAITTRSTDSEWGCTYEGLTYGSNRTILKLFVLNKNSWYDITVCKQIITDK